jgi:hypothetical protein
MNSDDDDDDADGRVRRHARGAKLFHSGAITRNLGSSQLTRSTIYACTPHTETFIQSASPLFVLPILVASKLRVHQLIRNDSCQFSLHVRYYLSIRYF